MIISETVTINDRQFIRTYSNEGFYILQNETGVEYSEAVDILDTPYTYTETDKPIEAETHQ